jgi:hypothetical protein
MGVVDDFCGGALKYGYWKEAAMRNAAALTAILLLTGCTYHYYPAPVAAPIPQEGQSAAAPDCREFTETVMIGGQPRQATGRACPQPDGTWKIQ